MTDYYSSQNGDWSSASTWGGAGVPGIGDRAFITGDTVYVDGNITVGTTPNNQTTMVLTVDSGGKLTWKDSPGSDWTLKVRGNINLAYNGTIEIGNETTALDSTQNASLVFEKNGSSVTWWIIWLSKYAEDNRGNIKIYGDPSHHMADAAKQRTRLKYSVSSGTDIQIEFDDAVDYEAGDTIWMGAGGDPGTELLNDSGVWNGGYGYDNPTLKTKINASTYTVDLSNNHLAGDMIVHATRNVYLGKDASDPQDLRFLIEQDNSTVWTGFIDLNWAYIKGGTPLFDFSGSDRVISSDTIKVKNCLIKDALNPFSVTGSNAVIEMNEESIDNVHFHNCDVPFLISLGDGGYQNHGAWKLGDITCIMNRNEGLTTGRIFFQIKSLWFCNRNGYHGEAIRTGYGFDIGDLKCHVADYGVYVSNTGLNFLAKIDGGEIYNTDYPIYILSQQAKPIIFRNIEIVNATYWNRYYTLHKNHSEFLGCSFDNLNRQNDSSGGAFLLTASGGMGNEWGTRFDGCTFGTTIQNNRANIKIDSYDYKNATGRIILSNCTFKEAVSQVGGGLWTGVKAWCIHEANLQTWGNRVEWNEGRTLEFINPTVLNSSDVDQWPVEYSGITHLAIVGGGGEVMNEGTEVVDETFAMKMLPYARHVQCAGSKAVPMEFPVTDGITATVKISFKKNISLVAGTRPTLHILGSGINDSIEMSDAIDTWEEVEVSGTAAEDGIVKVWVTPGHNTYGGSTDNYFYPSALGTVVVYADKLIVSLS